MFRNNLWIEAVNFVSNDEWKVLITTVCILHPSILYVFIGRLVESRLMICLGLFLSLHSVQPICAFKRMTLIFSAGG